MTLKDRLRPAVLIARRVRRTRPTIHELAWAQPRSFSQFGEDRWLLAHFGDQRCGFYVDVGAYHPFNVSNTYLLHRRGWRGINLEPDPLALAELKRHRPNDVNLPYAVSTTAGPVAFAAVGSFAGIEDETYLWPGMEGDRITVEARPLGAILNEYLPPGRAIDLLDVDCEGHDLEVLRSNDWDRYRPRVVLTEHHDGRAESPESFLRGQSYRLATRLDLTLVFVAQ